MAKRTIVKGAVDDLVLLDDVSEQGVVKNLQARYDQDLIYTYIGPVLVSVNPFKDIRGLYSTKLMQDTYGRHKEELAPHVYGSAEHAYRNLLSMGRDQCILVSGESGAGKTEAAKKIMEYITQVSNDRAEANANISVRDIKDALLNSNPVLEAFGNAQTLRNDNSSRFGKLLVIQMDYAGVPIGGKITNYLLEKPRVVGQTEGERSFHAFYQLCAGASGSLKQELRLKGADGFAYTRGTTKVRGIDDAKDFAEMDAAMAKVGIAAADKKELYRLVAAVLHLGNVEFEATRKGDATSVSRGTELALADAAALLQVGDADLARALTHRTIQNKLESITSPLTSTDECVKTRDALAKALYSRAFQRLVDLINTSIHTDMKELALSVLDIYGFEIMTRNSFEQLCINFCNEKLQQLFIELTLKAEQEEYDREGIKWTHIDYFNNKIVCDLIEGKRPAGIFAYLDEECIYPKGTDQTYLRKLEANLMRHPHYQSLATKTNNDPSEFMIKHYAGEVIYSVEGMLDKNKDTLFRDLIMVIGRGSKSAFLNSLFPEAREAHDGRKPITAGAAFVGDMSQLITDLEKCEPHYIRTIKPNDRKSGSLYDAELVKHQVRYLGLVENVRVRRAGFAYRSVFEFFVRRYKMLSPRTWPHARGEPKRDAATILEQLGIKDFELGKTKVFIREPRSVFKLEEARDKKLHDVARIIQKAYRAFKARLYFLRIREESVKLFNQNKRRRASYVLYFIGDYVFAQDNAAVTEHIDGRVKFADHVNVLDGKGKMTRHLLVMTGTALYLFHTLPAGMLKLVRTVALRDVRSFGLSTFADGFMLVDVAGEKPLPTLIMESMRKAEITTVLHEEFPRSVRKDLPLRFADSHGVTVEKKSLFGKKLLSKTLTFTEAAHLPGASTQLGLTKKDGVDPKSEMAVFVSPAFASKARVQLDDDIFGLVKIHQTPAGTRKKIPYQNFRRPTR